MYVYGQLLRAAVETLSSDPSTAADKFTGRLWYNTGTDLLKYTDAANAVHQIVGHDVTQTLTNKTLSGNTAVTLISGSGTLTLNTSGTVTLPNATDTLVGKATTDTFTNKTIAADGTGNSITNIANANIKAAAAIAANKLAALAADRVVVSDSSGFITSPLTTTTEINYVNGVTSAIQTQLDAKQLRSTLTTKGDLYVATASNVVARQGVGANGLSLTADSSQTNGMGWTDVRQDSGYELTNVSLACFLGSSALTVALKGKDGNDPSASNAVKVAFRNATLTTGTYAQVSSTAATSVTVSSGSTLGHTSGTPYYIYIYALNNAGTLELAVSSKLFDEATTVSTTAEGGIGAADSWGVMYSTTARTNVAFRLIGRLKSTQATAGTWATTPETSSSPTPVLAIKNRFARAYQKTSNITSTADAVVEVVFNTVGNDYYNNYSNSTGRYTAAETGQYYFSYGLNGTMGGTAASSWQAYCQTNGTGNQRGLWSSDTFVNSKSYKAVGSGIVDLAAGDYISIFSNPTAQAVALTATGGDNDQCYFYVYKLGLV